MAGSTGNSRGSAPKKKVVPEWLKPFQFKPGQSGNPDGRPKNTLKDFARKYLSEMSDAEKIAYLNNLEHGKIKGETWRMAEGNPKQEEQVTVDKEGVIALTEFFRLAAKPLKKKKK